jgi:hypothetical protein
MFDLHRLSSQLPAGSRAIRQSINDSGIQLKGYRLGARFVLMRNSTHAGIKAISV